MSPRAARRLAWATWTATVILLAGNILLAIANQNVARDLLFIVLGIVLALGYSTVGGLIASRHPGNAVGWLLAGLGLGVMLGIATDEYVNYAAVSGHDPLPGTHVVALIGSWIFVPVFVQLPFLFLLFPTGELPSRRWRVVARVVGGSAIVATLGLIVGTETIEPEPGLRYENPLSVEVFGSALAPLIVVAGVAMLAGGVLSVVALVVRYRRSSGEVRQQIRWLAYVGAAGAVSLLGSLITSTGVAGAAGFVAAGVLFFVFAFTLAVGIPVACAVAVLKYRLYDLDVVVKKTLVFGVLATFITLVYLAVVVGIPILIRGGRGSAFDLFQVAAVAIIALAFQPVRNRAQRLADRLVYGKRATPYEVLSQFSERMGGTYSADDVLPRMVQLIVAGTSATRAEVWLRVGASLRLEAWWPRNEETRAEPIAVGSEESPPIPQADRTIPVVDRGQLLGAIAVRESRSDPITPSQEELLRHLAAQAALVLRNVALIEELRASRQRLVTAQDQERRRLERNIHDGAQQQLVALAVKLGLAERLVARDPGAVESMLSELRGEAQSALEDLRDLARGIYPPLLADKGLAVALEAQARRSLVPVTVEPDGVGRYPQEVEAAIYFCVLEALQNAAKHAGASAVAVTLAERDGHLVFEVADDGAGFDAATTPRGSGLTNMADRLAALGGEVELVSTPGQGTTVAGKLPARQRETGG